MALEAVIYQQDSFFYGSKDYNNYFDLDHALQEEKPNAENLDIITTEQSSIGYCYSPPSPVAQNTTSSPETCATANGDGFFTGGSYSPTVTAVTRRKRRRTKTLKIEEIENQRMTHIAVERNRRRQMNDYLAVLRSLMPPSYAQRGDQASVVGGAINFVKELEQLLQFLEAYKLSDHHHHEQKSTNSDIFSKFFTFPQYTMRRSIKSPATVDAVVESGSSFADIEVTMVESHANIKILLKKMPKQLLKMVVGFQSLSLNILHLNVTTVDQSVLYSFSVKVEEECQLSTVNEIATAVHELVGLIHPGEGADAYLFSQN